MTLTANIIESIFEVGRDVVELASVAANGAVITPEMYQLVDARAIEVSRKALRGGSVTVVCEGTVLCRISCTVTGHYNIFTHSSEF